MKVLYGSKNIVKKCPALFSGCRLPIPSKVDRQDPVPLARQPSCELFPTFLVEDGAMREHNGMIAVSVEIPVDAALVLRVERNFLKRGSCRRALQERCAG